MSEVDPRVPAVAAELCVSATQERSPESGQWLGALLMAGSVACFTAMVICVKLVRESGMSTAEVMFWRNASVVPWLAFVYRGQARWRPNRLRSAIVRVASGGAAMGSYFWAVEELSLLHNTILQLTQPVFVALLAPFALGERLPRNAIAACTIAIVGALMVVLAPVEEIALVAAASVPLIPSLVRLFSSFASAFAHMSIRWATTPRADAGPPDTPETVVLAFTWVLAVGSLVAMALEGSIPGAGMLDDWWPAAWQVAGVAGFGIIGQILLSRAYAAAPAPFIALIGYLAVPLAMIADYLVWGVPPEAVGILGSIMMLAAGLLLRPRKTGR